MIRTRAQRQVAIQEAGDRIVERFRPEKIILLGSLARGRGGPDSDADLLVVMPATRSSSRRCPPSPKT